MGGAHCYYVYILSSKSRAIYTGVTNDIHTRTWQHKQGKGSSFTAKYQINRLVYYEQYQDIEEAILREKTIKGWLRRKKLDLISARNPTWEDLSAGWTFINRYEPTPEAKALAAASMGRSKSAGEQQVLRSAQHDKSGES